jgi:hypothetical protein
MGARTIPILPCTSIDATIAALAGDLHRAGDLDGALSKSPG